MNGWTDGWMDEYMNGMLPVPLAVCIFSIIFSSSSTCTSASPSSSPFRPSSAPLAVGANLSIRATWKPLSDSASSPAVPAPKSPSEAYARMESSSGVESASSEASLVHSLASRASRRRGSPVFSARRGG